MSRKSATDYIKKLSSNNVSGSIPQALDLIQQLKKAKGNPRMQNAVGASNLAGMMQHVAQQFAPQPQTFEEDFVTKVLKALNLLKLSVDTRLSQEQVKNVVRELLGADPLAQTMKINDSQLTTISTAILALSIVDANITVRETINNIVAELKRYYNVNV